MFHKFFVMALVSCVPAIAQGVDSVRFPDIQMAGITSSRRGIVEEPVASVIEDKIYVAVAKQVKESKSVLLWALQNSGGKRICIIHVHTPAQMIPVSKFLTFPCIDFALYALLTFDGGRNFGCLYLSC